MQMFLREVVPFAVPFVALLAVLAWLYKLMSKTCRMPSGRSNADVAAAFMEECERFHRITVALAQSKSGRFALLERRLGL